MSENVVWVITREPKESALADTVISLGSVRALTGVLTGVYLVFRGEPENVIEVLEEALNEAREALPAGQYTDKRGKSQG